MKNFYYAAWEERDGKNLAFVISASESDNLLSVFARSKALKAVNACATKKAAERIAEIWNQDFEKNGTSWLATYTESIDKIIKEQNASKTIPNGLQG